SRPPAAAFGWLARALRPGTDFPCLGHVLSLKMTDQSVILIPDGSACKLALGQATTGRIVGFLPETHGSSPCSRRPAKLEPADPRRLAGAMARGDPRTRLADRRSAPSPLGPAGLALSARRFLGRREQRPSRPRHRFRAMSRHVPPRRTGGIAPAR